MRNYLIPSLLALTLVGCKTAQKPVIDIPQQPERSIVIVYDNDVHCGIEGYSRMAGLRDAVSDTAYVAMVSSGDYLQGGTPGAISKGMYVAEIMKHMHYDAVTLGNHEFDYGVPRMLELLDTIGAPVVCVNLRDMDNRRVFQPFVMREFGNRKVAIVGVVTPTALYTEAYSFYDKDDKQLYNLAEKETYQLVQEQVDAARAQGADYVVVISHLGEDKNDINVDSHGLAASTRGIDVILDGHTHSVIPYDYVLNPDGKQVLVTQTGTKFQHVGRLVILPNGKIFTELTPIDKIEHRNSEVQHATDSIVRLSDELVRRPICKSDVALRILDENGKQLVRHAETNAGDLVTDAYRIITGADFAITNGGGIRSELEAGQLTYGDIVSLLPYDNYVSIVEITGSQLVEVLQACTQFAPVENGDFPQVSGIKYTLVLGQPNLLADVMVLDGKTGEYVPVELDRTYRLATIDYCITGGGLQGKLKKNNIILPNITVYNECLIQYVTEKLQGHIGTEYAEPQGRITIK